MELEGSYARLYNIHQPDKLDLELAEVLGS
jgi:hypothetical protein